MDQTRHDAIIEKIKKLLALSQSPNQEEAERAAEKARELLTKYDLSVDQFEDIQVEEKIIKQFLKKPNLWRLTIFGTISEFYFCRFIIKQTQYSDATVYGFDIIGKSHHITIASSVCEYIEKAIVRISRERCRANAKSKFRESFRYGMAVEICTRLETMKRIRETGGPGEEKSLILKEDQKIQEYLSRMDLSSFDSGKKPNNKSAFRRGVEAGANVALNEQIKNDRYAIGQ